MNEPKPYRNALRSKRLILNAYLTLLLGEDGARIKTKDVIELANISKGTFYAHYASLQNVQREIEDDQLGLMFGIFEDLSPQTLMADFTPLFLNGLRAMEQKRDLFYLLFCASGGGFWKRVKQTFLDYMLGCADLPHGAVDAGRLKQALTFVAGGALTVIHDWLGAGCNQPAQEVAEQLNHCALQGIHSFFPA